ncbi:membrane protein insertion efficiency factor YidD [Candidatus Fermentibacterales bacterium]|nr:membrane protein insertion efficiency factor YidD [Candidatus Fermentibacterales bacterium]
MAAVILFLSLSCAWEPVSLPATDPVPAVPGAADALLFEYRLLARDLLARRCNFYPSCSIYGQLAISEYGPVVGVIMALERWTRCHASAREQDYYEPAGSRLSDPVHIMEGLEPWDCLLLPF